MYIDVHSKLKRLKRINYFQEIYASGRVLIYAHFLFCFRTLCLHRMAVMPCF